MQPRPPFAAIVAQHVMIRLHRPAASARRGRIGPAGMFVPRILAQRSGEHARGSRSATVKAAPRTVSPDLRGIASGSRSGFEAPVLASLSTLRWLNSRTWRLPAALVLAAALANGGRAAPAPELTEALRTFRTDGPKGWSFTQTTRGAGHSRVERFDAARPEFERWTLLQQDDRAPTEEESRSYREQQTRRSRGGTAPLLTDQLDLTSAELIRATSAEAVYRCRLNPGEKGDVTAQHLAATIVVDRPTSTVRVFELAAVEPFAPAFAVRIAAMSTKMTYSVPTPDRPSLLLGIETRLRGRAFWVKSLDADLSVVRTDQEKAHR